jgi:hypothetical protein
MTITPTMKWGAAVAAALVVGVLAGRFSKPTKVVEVERKVEVAAKVEAAATDKDTSKTVRKTTTTRTAPGRPPASPPAAGEPCPACPPVTETIVEEETIDTTSDETETVSENLEVVDTEKTRIEENAKAWFALEGTYFIPTQPGQQQGLVTAQFRLPWLPLWVGAGVGYTNAWVFPVQVRAEF